MSPDRWIGMVATILPLPLLSIICSDVPVGDSFVMGVHKTTAALQRNNPHTTPRIPRCLSGSFVNVAQSTYTLLERYYEELRHLALHLTKDQEMQRFSHSLLHITALLCAQTLTDFYTHGFAHLRSPSNSKSENLSPCDGKSSLTIYL